MFLVRDCTGGDHPKDRCILIILLVVRTSKSLAHMLKSLYPIPAPPGHCPCSTRAQFRSRDPRLNFRWQSVDFFIQEIGLSLVTFDITTDYHVPIHQAITFTTYLIFLGWAKVPFRSLHPS